MATISQLTNLPLASLDGTEEFWAQKNGLDYRVDLTDLRNYFGGTQYTSLVIPTASVLTLNGTPLTIVAAPGAGYAIEAIAASVKLIYNSVVYATNTDIGLITDTANTYQIDGQTVLNASVSSIRKLTAVLNNFTATDTQIIENKALQVKVDTGNPTAGDSDITVYVAYRIITI